MKNTEERPQTPEEILSQILVSGAHTSASLSSKLYTEVTKLQADWNRFDPKFKVPSEQEEAEMAALQEAEIAALHKKLKILQETLPSLSDVQRRDLAVKEILAHR